MDSSILSRIALTGRRVSDSRTEFHCYKRAPGDVHSVPPLAILSTLLQPMAINAAGPGKVCPTSMEMEWGKEKGEFPRWAREEGKPRLAALTGVHILAPFLSFSTAITSLRFMAAKEQA